MDSNHPLPTVKGIVIVVVQILEGFLLVVLEKTTSLESKEVQVDGNPNVDNVPKKVGEDVLLDGTIFILGKSIGIVVSVISVSDVVVEDPKNNRIEVLTFFEPPPKEKKVVEKKKICRFRGETIKPSNGF